MFEQLSKLFIAVTLFFVALFKIAWNDTLLLRFDWLRLSTLKRGLLSHIGRKPINANNLSAIVYKRGISLRFERGLKRFKLSYIHTQWTLHCLASLKLLKKNVNNLTWNLLNTQFPVGSLQKVAAWSKLDNPCLWTTNLRCNFLTTFEWQLGESVNHTNSTIVPANERDNLFISN